MLGINTWQKTVKAIAASLMIGILVLSLSSCGNRSLNLGSKVGATTPASDRSTNPTQLAANIAEVSPPAVIQQLRQALEIYQPQVKILSPQPDEVLQNDTVTARFQVQDLPIFKNSELDMGPHLHVILDNQPYIAVYDLNQPLVLPDLSPGTHTLRIFASRPWHESFKNEGAYAQTTFHIFTKTDDNNPDSTQPLLTYSRPKGSYGAEPILLDFYLTNAPLHFVAQENSQDEIADWRIRCTINGSSFVIDRWQPIYLQGFKPGKNWVQLEFLDEQGNPVKNVFNNTVRVITYEAQGKDTLSKLIRGDLSANAARGIVDPTYTATIPEVTPTPTPSPVPTLLPSPTPSPEPVTPTPPLEETIPELQPDAEKAAETVEPQEPDSNSTKTENQKPQGFFNRFRRSSATPAPVPEPVTPNVEVPQLETSPEPQPLVTPEAETPPEALELKQPEKQKSGGFFNRFRRANSTSSPKSPPTVPEIIEPSTSKLVPPEALPQSESVPTQEPFNTNEDSVNQENNTDIESEASKPRLDIKQILLP